MENLKKAKEELFDHRMTVAKQRKTKPWTMDQLLLVLKSLKSRKSRDPHGLCNEIFKPEVAGHYFQEAILKLLNMVKEQQKVSSVF